MKRILLIAAVFFVSLGLLGYSTQKYNDYIDELKTTTASMEPKQVVKLFFDDFEKADYEGMKAYCSDDCINTYFHDNDVFGMKSAKAVKIYEKDEADFGTFIKVHVEMEPAENSELQSETLRTFFVVLKQKGDSTWAIDKFVTGEKQ